MHNWRAGLLGLAVLGAGLLLGAGPTAREQGCPGAIEGAWRAPLCDAAELAPVWAALARMETPASKEGRAAFDGQVARCVDARARPAGSALRQAQACVRDRLWARVRLLARQADRESPVGLYLWRDRDSVGELRILPQTDGRPRIELSTRIAPRQHSCTVTLTRAWTTRRALAWKGELEPGMPASLCEFTFLRTGPDEIRIVSDQKCVWICGAGGDYRYAFRARP